MAALATISATSRMTPGSAALPFLRYEVPAGRVLIAHADPRRAEVLGDCLEKQGNRVWTATDGTRALAVAQRQRLDLVIADRRLGADLPERIRGLQPDVVVLLVLEPQQAAALAALTPREREVLAAVAEGRPNREIAGKLFLSEKTVRNNLTSLYEKLGVKSRTQAALLARQVGL